MCRVSMLFVLLLAPVTVVAAPNPVITTVTPAGGRVGTSGEVTVTGSGLEPLRYNSTA